MYIGDIGSRSSVLIDYFDERNGGSAVTTSAHLPLTRGAIRGRA